MLLRAYLIDQVTDKIDLFIDIPSKKLACMHVTEMLTYNWSLVVVVV